MKNLILLIVISLTLSSCYAFLQADKLIYAGTIAKSPKQIKVDTLYQVE